MIMYIIMIYYKYQSEDTIHIFRSLISYFNHDNHYLTHMARRGSKTVKKYCGYKLHPAGAYAFEEQRFG